MKQINNLDELFDALEAKELWYDIHNGKTSKSTLDRNSKFQTQDISFMRKDIKEKKYFRKITRENGYYVVRHSSTCKLTVVYIHDNWILESGYTIKVKLKDYYWISDKPLNLEDLLDQ